ncbi:MAG: hypothetical protein ACOCNX_00695 [Prevotella sp.]
MKKVKYPLTEAVVVFCFNFPNYHEIIKWIADRVKRCSYEHLLEKWEHFADVYSPADAWLHFYMDCDSYHREALTDYITEVFAPSCGNFTDDDLAAMDELQYPTNNL